MVGSTCCHGRPNIVYFDFSCRSSVLYRRSTKRESPMKKYLSPEQVAELLAVNSTEVWSWIEHGELRAFRVGAGFRIAEGDIERFLEARVHHPDRAARPNNP